MAKNDQLDLLLQDKRLTEEDWEGLAEVLRVKEELPADPEERRVFINMELRHSYGHTVVNFFREWWEPDYEDIVRDVARKLKIPVRDHYKIEELEGKIVVEVIDSARERIVKKEGPEAWKKIEEEADREIGRLIEEGNIPKEMLENLKKARSMGVMTALVAGKLAGFKLYIVANQLFFSIARYLGLKVGVAVAGPIIGKVLAFLLGPAGWILAGLLLVFDLGNTSWKKVIPAVVLTASMRGRLLYEE